MSCLHCDATRVEMHHWPVAKGMGGRSKEEDDKLPRVPLCVPCHTAYHAGDGRVVETLIRCAPSYWQDVGWWERAQPLYDKFVSRRIYLEGLRCT